MTAVPTVELRHLRYFCALADEQHFGRAATRLALSQPALSVQIKQLEEMVGTRLFDRHSRQVTLTDAGRVFDEAARRILRDVEGAAAAARRASAGETGTLRVGFGPSLMQATLAQVIRAYVSRYPDVRVDLRELPAAEQREALLRGELDVAFMRGAQQDARLDVEPFAREPLLIAVNHEHPGAKAKRLPLARLAGDPWVLFPRIIAPQLYDQVLGLCRDAGFVPHVVQESREVYTTVGLVGAGIGVTIVPQNIARMSWPDIVYHPIPRASVQLSIVRPSGAVRPVVRTFLDVVRATAERPAR
jgi:DNA-binding transcriptional LysR family regulator